MKTYTICGSMRFDKEMKEIALSDGIYVVNIEGYIGESVKMEIGDKSI